MENNLLDYYIPKVFSNNKSKIDGGDDILVVLFPKMSIKIKMQMQNIGHYMQC